MNKKLSTLELYVANNSDNKYICDIADRIKEEYALNKVYAFEVHSANSESADKIQVNDNRVKK